MSTDLGYNFQLISVSTFQLISVPTFQLISAPTFQLISVATFQLISVAAFQLISIFTTLTVPLFGLRTALLLPGDSVQNIGCICFAKRQPFSGSNHEKDFSETGM